MTLSELVEVMQIPDIEARRERVIAVARAAGLGKLAEAAARVSREPSPLSLVALMSEVDAALDGDALDNLVSDAEDDPELDAFERRLSREFTALESQFASFGKKRPCQSR